MHALMIIKRRLDIMNCFYLAYLPDKVELPIRASVLKLLIAYCVGVTVLCLFKKRNLFITFVLYCSFHIFF